MDYVLFDFELDVLDFVDESESAEGDTYNKASKIQRHDTVVDGSKETKKNSKAPKKKQYVLFVGNLPYSVTKEDVVQHFNSTGVFQVIVGLGRKPYFVVFVAFN